MAAQEERRLKAKNVKAALGGGGGAGAGGAGGGSDRRANGYAAAFSFLFRRYSGEF